MGWYFNVRESFFCDRKKLPSGTEENGTAGGPLRKRDAQLQAVQPLFARAGTRIGDGRG